MHNLQIMQTISRSFNQLQKITGVRYNNDDRLSFDMARLLLEHIFNETGDEFGTSEFCNIEGVGEINWSTDESGYVVLTANGVCCSSNFGQEELDTVTIIVTPTKRYQVH